TARLGNRLTVPFLARLFRLPLPRVDAGDVNTTANTGGNGQTVGVVRIKRHGRIRQLGSATRLQLSALRQILHVHLWVSLRSGRGGSPAATGHVATNPRSDGVHVDSGRVDLPARRDFLVSAHAVGGQSERLSQLAAQGDVSV